MLAAVAADSGRKTAGNGLAVVFCGLVLQRKSHAARLFPREATPSNAA
jgi:hypothetical protein